MTKKPGERIKEIFDELCEKGGIAINDIGSFPYRVLAIEMFLEEEYERNKPCEHEWIQTTIKIEDNYLFNCSKCLILKEYY